MPGFEEVCQVRYLFQATPWLLVQPDFRYYVASVPTLK